jgi:hypothetical protein
VDLKNKEREDLMTDYFLDKLFLQNTATEKIFQKWLDNMQSDSAEEFLELLLKGMSLVFELNLRNFRKNIEGFTGKYLFTSKDKGITVSAIFDKGKMKVYEAAINDADVVITFRNDKALMDYIFSPKPDILGSMLRQDVTLNGNLNYLYKFAFMAQHLRLMATGGL